MTKRSAKILQENSGVQAAVENKDIEEYIRLGRNRKEVEQKGSRERRQVPSITLLCYLSK
jgi:hypothetical protein